MMLKKSEIDLLDKYFRAVNYVSACQLYLLDNPLLKRPLTFSDVSGSLGNCAITKFYLYSFKLYYKKI